MKKMLAFFGLAIMLFIATSGRIDNEYIVYYETTTKILQGKGLWGEKDGIEDSDGICRYKGFNVSFAYTVTVFASDSYQECVDYIIDNELIFPEE
jgi:hypothetical protein